LGLGGLRFVHGVGNFFDSSCGWCGTHRYSFAGEVGPALSVHSSNTSYDVLALVLLVLSTPEGAHGECAAFVVANLFVRSVAQCLVLLGDTIVASLNVHLVSLNFFFSLFVWHLPANLNFPFSDESRSSNSSEFAFVYNNLLYDGGGRRQRRLRLRSGLDLECLGPSTPAEGVLGADSVEVEFIVYEISVTLRQVAGLESLIRRPSLRVSLVPLELEHLDLDADSSSLISVKVIPVDIDGVTGSIRSAKVG